MEFENTGEINFRVKMDENHIPEEINWKATSQNEKGVCKAALISLWDKKEKNTLKIDLWTKDMMVDEMKIFFHQTLVSMANTFEQATNETQTAGELRTFCKNFAEKFNLLDHK